MLQRLKRSYLTVFNFPVAEKCNLKYVSAIYLFIYFLK